MPSRETSETEQRLREFAQAGNQWLSLSPIGEEQPPRNSTMSPRMNPRIFGIHIYDTTSSTSGTNSAIKWKEPDGSYTDPIIVEEDDDGTTITVPGPRLAENPTSMNHFQDTIIIENYNPNETFSAQNRNVHQRTSSLGNHWEAGTSSGPPALQSGYLGNPDHEEQDQEEEVDEEEEEEEEEDYLEIDPDIMTYEELLALEEQIGDVERGLSRDEFERRIKHYRYKAPKNAQEEAGCCCICLEDFRSRFKIGVLDCGHEFHFNCIKTWLMQNNICPMCKRDGLAEP